MHSLEKSERRLDHWFNPSDGSGMFVNNCERFEKLETKYVWIYREWTKHFFQVQKYYFP